MDTRPVLTSFSNPLVKQARALKQRKARMQSGLFLVEGLHHIGSALEAGWELDALLYAPELLTGDFARSLLESVQRLGLTPQPVSAQVMESLAEKDNPQGVLALVRQKQYQPKDSLMIHNAVALVSPQDPGNVGTILRTVDAVGVDALFLIDGGVDLYHPTLVRASMGSIFWKPVVQLDFGATVEWAREKGFTLIGASARAEMDYRHMQPVKGPWLLILGSEQKGLTPEQAATCDHLVSLPMHGHVSSLNLAVAAGVLLYALNT